MKTKVAIIIVTWNKVQYVTNLLESLKTIEKGNYETDIIVVDNASTDNTVEEITGNFPYVKLIVNQENLGGTGGFNTGMKYILESNNDYKYFWLLDNDVEVDSQAFIQLVNTLENNDEVGAVGSQMRQLDNKKLINENGGLISPERFGLFLLHHRMPVNDFKKTPDHNELIPTHFCAAASLMVRTEVLSEVGLWSDFFIHFDDVEWCVRIRKSGYKIVCNPKSVIWHISGDSKPLTWVLYYDVRNYLTLLKMHYNQELVLRTIKFYISNAYKDALKGRIHIARLYLLGIESFLKGETGKSKHELLPKNWITKWDDLIENTIPGASILSVPNFAGKEEATLLQKLLTRSGNLSIWASQGDFMASAYLVGANIEFYPVKKLKRIISILKALFSNKKKYKIGIVPHDLPSVAFNSQCENVYLAIENGLVKIDTSKTNLLKNLLYVRKTWNRIKKLI